MARRKTRRSISVRGLTYQRLKGYCDARGIAVSAYLETIIAADMAAMGVPEETVLRPRPTRERADTEEIAGQHFTF